ncbi:hypothetical protein D3C77_598680 [compost metagenome]
MTFEFIGKVLYRSVEWARAHRSSGPGKRWAQAHPAVSLLHLDDHLLLPELRQRLGGFFPGGGVLDRLDLGVLLVG